MTAHGALEAEFPPGTMVRYYSTPLQPYEFGLVVRANDTYVFVRFARHAQSKACRPESLAVVVDAITDVLVGAADESNEQES